MKTDKNTTELKKSLVVGAKIKIGKEYIKEHGSEYWGFKNGQVIELVNGDFEYDNGLYTETQYSPSYKHTPEVAKDEGEFESIYHMFGNKLDKFMDCEVINE